MTVWNSLVFFLPFDWAEYDFMRNALLAAILIAPCLGIIGTMVVGRGMAFFSDAVGHSALTGVALGVLMGVSNPEIVMVAFVIVLAFIIHAVTMFTKTSADTVIGIFSASAVALGVALLSRGGSFNKYTVYLVGDILSVSHADIMRCAVLCVVVVLFWIFFSNNLFITSIDISLASNKRTSAFIIQSLFSVLVAAVVALSIKWVGILVINSLLVLPAASARLCASSLRLYTFLSASIGFVSGIAGLIISFYAGSAGGASIVLCAVVFYLLSLVYRYVIKR